MGSITKPINSDYHLSSDLILADVLHSMSILSIPGDEGLFSFKAEELKQVNLNLLIIVQLSAGFDSSFKNTLKDTQINTAKILMNRLRKEIK